MRQLIIDLDEANLSKEDQVKKVLESMGINFHTSDRQTIEEYNEEIDEAVAQYERGESI